MAFFPAGKSHINKSQLTFNTVTSCREKCYNYAGIQVLVLVVCKLWALPEMTEGLNGMQIDFLLISGTLMSRITSLVFSGNFVQDSVL